MKRLSMAMTAIAVLGLMTMVSCRKPNVNNAIPGAPRTVTFNATTESGDGSKTTLDGFDVKWSEGDQIKVNNQTMTLATGAGTTSCTFTGEVSGTEFYAGYPVSAVSYTAPSTLSVNIPAEMEYNAENPTEGLVRMVAHTTSSGDKAMLNFKNAVNVLKLQLKGVSTSDDPASNLTSIVLMSTSNLNGNIGVTFNGQEATFSYADGSNTSTVTFGSGSSLQLKSDETKYVYILLPKINGGELTLKFNCSNGKYMSKKITVTSAFDNVNNMLHTPELTVDAQTTPVDVDPSVTTNNVCDGCEYKGARGSVTSSTTQECEYGFVYAKTAENADPTIGGIGCKKFCYAIGEVTSTGVTFNADLDLEPGVGYSFKAYAIGENGNKICGAVKTITGIDTPKAVNWNGGGTQGASPKEFTVNNSPVTKVRFSQGNLQYIGGTETWKFADHQFDFLGTTTGQNSATETVDRDLFGWCTSNQYHGATCYQPWSTSRTYSDYYAYGNDSKHLYSEIPATADWGYNSIYSGSTATIGWRTLTNDEWGYLLNTRKDASNRFLYGQGMVGNCTPGLIILPDEWDWNATELDGMRKPNGIGDLKFTLGQSAWMNTYSYTDWSKMESLGAVFLPAAGYRGGTSVYSVGLYGYYWSSSYSNSDCAYLLDFYSGYVYPQYYLNRYHGFSVRLVR